jgi:P27 family predicted phage terminase small subunit
MMPNPPKSLAARQLSGNAGNRPINENEPKPAISAPPRPAFLVKEAKREWDRIVPELEALGMISRIDLACLAGYCVAFGRWCDAERELKRHGVLVTTPNGHTQPSPYLSIANKALEQLNKLVIQLGLSPASRPKVAASPPTDNADDFFR